MEESVSNFREGLSDSLSGKNFAYPIDFLEIYFDSEMLREIKGLF